MAVAAEGEKRSEGVQVIAIISSTTLPPRNLPHHNVYTIKYSMVQVGQSGGKRTGGTQVMMMTIKMMRGLAAHRLAKNL